MSSGLGHTVTWYSYNLPNTINADGANGSQFFYAPDRSRWKQVASYGGTTEQTIYVGGVMEKVTLGGVTSWKQYISGGTGTVAIYTRTSAGGAAVQYLTKDHLGSVDSVSNASGTVLARLFFGSAGQRRSEATWSGNPSSADWSGITGTTRRGYTEHEMLDNLNLTHMNGRVYDQVIGRFISPDPFIDGVGSTQGWNRYAYVHNNPLSFTDPSGFDKADSSETRTECRADPQCANATSSSGGLLWNFSRRTNPYHSVIYDRNAIRDVAASWNLPNFQPVYSGADLQAILDALTPAGMPRGAVSSMRTLGTKIGVVGESGTDSTVGGSSVYVWADFINDAADFSAGWGDLVSFGLTARTRELWDIGSVDPSSGAYSSGEVFGFVNVALTGYGAGTRAAARASSATGWSNFSHSLFPHRWLRRFNNPIAKWLDRTGNRLNGDFVSAQLHTRMDAAAQFGLSAAWLRANPLFSPLRQWINRLPYTPGSILYGTGSAAINCTDDCE